MFILLLSPHHAHIQVCLGHLAPKGSCPLSGQSSSFVPMSLEAFLPDFNLRKHYRQTGISLKRYQRRYALLTKIFYTLEIMLASLYPCMSVLLMDVHSLLSDIQTAKLQIKTHLFLFLNSLTILELISRYPSFIFYPM